MGAAGQQRGRIRAESKAEKRKEVALQLKRVTCVASLVNWT